MSAPPITDKGVWQIGRPGCYSEGAARQIIFKMIAMRRGNFPPMCDNARQGARRRRPVEPALILREASTPDARYREQGARYRADDRDEPVAGEPRCHRLGPRASTSC